MKKYNHVIFFGIDGGGAFVRFANTPNIDRIFENGAKTYRAYASYPSISAECWGSLLLGVSPAVHKMTNGSISENIHPVDSPYPSVFRRIREANPNAVLGSFCHWSPINYGIVEDGIGVTKVNGSDAALIAPICDYIKNEKPAFLFIHSDSVDGAGHGNGYGTVAHLTQIAKVDEYVSAVYQAVVDAGIADDTLFCIICDHGGTLKMRFDGEGQPMFGCYCGSHGGWSDGEKFITFMAVGKGVKAGEIEEMNIRDSAAVILYALGIETPKFEKEAWTSQIPTGLFEDDVPAYMDISDETGAEPRISRVQRTSEPV